MVGEYWPFDLTWPFGPSYDTLPPQPMYTYSTETRSCEHCWCGVGPKRNGKPHVCCCKCGDTTLKKG